MLPINDKICLTKYSEADKPALVEWLNDRNIYERTLRIPYPYSPADADRFLSLIAECEHRAGQEHWAIRRADEVIGGVGLEGESGGHRAEIGYWLATPFWGQGIMTDVVRRVCRHAFDDLGLVKITAHVFLHNPASARVLEKCGFTQEGLLRKHFVKDGALIDVRLFGLVRE